MSDSVDACLEIWSTRNQKVRESERDSRRAAVFKSLEHITRATTSWLSSTENPSCSCGTAGAWVLGAERGEQGTLARSARLCQETSECRDRHERSSIRNALDYNTILKAVGTLCTLCVGMQLARIASIRWASSVVACPIHSAETHRYFERYRDRPSAYLYNGRSPHIQTVEMQM
jgi:hypothetical protein